MRRSKGCGCSTFLFALVLVAIVGVFALAPEHRGWAAVTFLVALGLAIAYQAADSEGW
jgi:hypothetical protein